MKRFAALLCLALICGASAQELQKFEGCRFVEAEWADGDSFPVKLPDGKEIVLRLYCVDCNEVAATTETDQRRVREQSSCFGIDDHQITLGSGRLAAEEVKRPLAERIVEARPYQSVGDLRRVPGIGEKVFARLKDSLHIEA
jgi:hypothetical protein